MSSSPVPHARWVAGALAATILAASSGVVAQSERAQQVLDKMPARFIPNQGQWSSTERYRVEFGGMQAYLQDRGWTFCLREKDASKKNRRGVVVRMTFAGAQAKPTIEPGQRLSLASNYFIGADRSTHRSAVPAFGSLTYRSMYKGVDVRVRESSRRLEYDLILAPDADLSAAQIVVEGVESMRVDKQGSLVMQTAIGPIHQPVPTTFALRKDGSRVPVQCRYVLLAKDRFGFRAPDWNRKHPLVVDPVVLYSSYFGDSGREEAWVVREALNNKIYVGGRSNSTSLPTTTGVFQATHGGGSYDGFVFRVDPTKLFNATLEYCTYFGGTGDDLVADMAIQLSGSVNFCGQTSSSNLPVSTTAYQKTLGGGNDAFVAVLNGTGSGLIGCSYLGGNADELANGLAIAPGGFHAVVGWTTSSNFPTTFSGYDTSFNGGTLRGDCFATLMTAACSVVTYSTYLGGNNEDGPWRCQVNGSGVFTFSGSTTSTNFPTSPGAYDSTYNGGNQTNNGDLFVVQLDPSKAAAAQLTYSTLLGGNSDEFSAGCHVDSAGVITIAGTTASTNLPTTTGAYQAAFAGGAATTGTLSGDAVVARLNPLFRGPQQLVFCTYIGGPGEDRCWGMFVDADGVTTIAGWSAAANNAYPTTPDAAKRFYVSNESFVTRLGADGKRLLYSTFFGGLYSEAIWDITSRSKDEVTVCGLTGSFNGFPWRNGFQSYNKGGTDAFVSRLQLQPQGTSRYGTPTSSGGYHPTIHILGDPTPNNSPFGLGCSQAPPSTLGFFALSIGSIPNGLPIGFTLYIDPGQPTVILPVRTNAAGEFSFQTRYPSTKVPVPVYAQFLWASATPTASDAMKF